MSSATSSISAFSAAVQLDRISCAPGFGLVLEPGSRAESPIKSGRHSIICVIHSILLQPMRQRLSETALEGLKGPK